MKNLFVLFLVSVTTLVMSCDSELGLGTKKGTNPLIGTWENSTGTSIETYEFSETTIKITNQSDNDPAIIQNGTYQYYDTIIIFRMEDDSNFFADYSITNNELTMTFSHNNNTMTYQKRSP